MSQRVRAKSDSGGGGRDPCSSCAGVFPTNPNNDCIDCDLCGGWFHGSCVTLSVTDIKAITKLEVKGVRFFCHKCLGKVSGSANNSNVVDTALNGKLDDISHQLVKIQNSVSEIDKSIQKSKGDEQYSALTKVVGDIKQGVENLTSGENSAQSYASVLTKSIGDMRSDSESLSKQIKASVDRTSKIISDQYTQQDQERRKVNVIIHRVPEAGQQSLKQKVSDLAKAIHYNPEQIVQCFRLGKPEENKTRPIKLVLATEIKKWEFLKQINASKPDGVFATVDLSKEDREKDFKARQKLKQLKRENSDSAFKIKNFKVCKQEGERWVPVS